MKVKIKLHSWNDSESFMKADKVIYNNHRGNEKFLYKVISRHCFDSFGNEFISDKLKGLIYYPVDVLQLD